MNVGNGKTIAGKNHNYFNGKLFAVVSVIVSFAALACVLVVLVQNHQMQNKMGKPNIENSKTARELQHDADTREVSIENKARCTESEKG